ncbi:TetR family transcriptional regulator [Gordonia sp. ABSL1-1]|uniref:TetR/AcrR family transcriptional regulator n=1 Tax=Gordonia sp. ABSL1-1 TaxID=3053923 RepID=UPI002572DCAD|nr:TetR family transcriptional regulator [Gordonia sp. ABSL1-1]MDL9938880.1 TetR family transcriptional regulator [Gordonia sp. ABSL1-1]
MPPDATSTKSRILVAARTEFAHYGLAGARVDRIAEKADANKRSIYVHFGPKEQLFDLVVARALSEMAESVPFTPDDLPGYAGLLFDYLVADPAILRLITWAGLERSEATEEEVRTYAPKVDALNERYSADGADVLALLLGSVTAWPAASPALRSHTNEDPWSKTRLRAHRAVVVLAVEALVAALDPADQT